MSVFLDDVALAADLQNVAPEDACLSRRTSRNHVNGHVRLHVGQDEYEVNHLSMHRTWICPPRYSFFVVSLVQNFIPGSIPMISLYIDDQGLLNGPHSPLFISTIKDLQVGPILHSPYRLPSCNQIFYMVHNWEKNLSGAALLHFFLSSYSANSFFNLGLCPLSPP